MNAAWAGNIEVARRFEFQRVTLTFRSRLFTSYLCPPEIEVMRCALFGAGLAGRIHVRNIAIHPLAER